MLSKEEEMGIRNFKLLLALFLGVVGSVSGQVEIYPGAATIQFSAKPAHPDVEYQLSEGNGFLLGVDALAGSRNLAPLAAVYFQRVDFLGVNQQSIKFSRLLLPIGLAYRLRPANTSFNLIPSTAIVPVISMGNKDLLPEYEVNSFQFQARFGLVLTLDMITFGTHYWPSFGGFWKNSSAKPNFFSFSLGIRF